MFYSFLMAILLIILGLLSISTLILAKKPSTIVLFAFIKPFQGWIGVIFCIWGIYCLIDALLNIVLLKYAPIVWILYVIIAVVEIVLGFILGFNIINNLLLARNAKTKEKGKQLLTKLKPLQTGFGIVAIVIGILAIIGFMF